MIDEVFGHEPGETTVITWIDDVVERARQNALQIDLAAYPPSATQYKAVTDELQTYGGTLIQTSGVGHYYIEDESVSRTFNSLGVDGQVSGIVDHVYVRSWCDYDALLLDGQQLILPTVCIVLAHAVIHTPHGDVEACDDMCVVLNSRRTRIGVHIDLDEVA